LLVNQIGATNDAIAPYVRPEQGLYFRAPYGVWRRAHAEFLNQDPVLKHYVGPIYWDIGGELSYDDEGRVAMAADWDCWSQDLTSDQCGEGYLREIRRKKGGIVLMHDIRRQTVAMVAQVLPTLIAEGYTFVTLDEVRALDQYRTPPDEDVAPEDVPIAMFDGRYPLSAAAR
jgi:peptidoglycan/xylan/chitin deacetylase (PgdA/CDA1 family)